MVKNYFDEERYRTQLEKTLRTFKTVHGVDIDLPELGQHNPRWKGKVTYNDFQFHHHLGHPGVVSINGDRPFGNARIFHGTSHELGHVAMFQTHTDYQNLTRQYGRRFQELDEGLAEHIRIDCCLHVAKKENNPMLFWLAERSRCSNKIKGRLFFDPYARGYRKVAKLRAQEISIKEILEHPKQYL